MEIHCSSCGKVLSGAETLYTASAQAICQACNDKAEVAQALHVPRAALDIPSRVDGLVAGREYEFNGEENAVISSLAKPMTFVGMMLLIFGIISIVLSVRSAATLRGLLDVAEGALFMVTGTWLMRAAGSLRDVVDTEGSDITNLMFALVKLRNVYLLQAILWVFACVLIAIKLLSLL